MKLLSQIDAKNKTQEINDELIESNVRLRRYEKSTVERLNTIRDTYEPEKIKRLKDFEEFCKDIQSKKSTLLRELKAISDLVEKKKDLYYAVIARQDALDDRLYKINEANKKLDLREAHMTDLETKWRIKNA